VKRSGKLLPDRSRESCAVRDKRVGTAGQIETTQPACEDGARQRAGGLVDDAAHRRVDELLPQHPQPPLVQLGHRDRAHQPAHDRHAVQAVHQRRDPVGIADVGLGPGRGDLGHVGAAGGSAHGVARGSQFAGQCLPARAAGDDQDPCHSFSTSSRVRSRPLSATASE